MINIQKAGQSIITLSIEDREKNTNNVNERFIMHFETLVEEITRDESTRGIIITSAKSDFLLEQDFSYFTELDGALSKRDYLLRLQKSMNMLESWGKPVVAALSGSAQGAGFEISLACHHRIAIDHNTIRFSLSSPDKGLMSGLGGIQRLSRLVGIEQAEKVLSNSRSYSPQQAWDIGLINGLADTNAQMMEMAFAWIEQHPSSHQPWVGRIAKDPLDPKGIEGKKFFRNCSEKLFLGNSSYAYSLRKIYERLHDGFLVDFRKACNEDATALVELFLNDKSRNVINTLFFGSEDCKRWSRIKSKEIQPLKTIGLTTSSEQANSLILSLICAGFNVLLKNQDRTKSETQKNTIAKELEQLVLCSFISKEVKEFQLSLLEVSESLEEFRNCDLIIEDSATAFKDLESFREHIRTLQELKKKGSVLASTLGNYSLSDLTTNLESSEDIIGLKFNSKLESAPIVELMKSPQTSGHSIKTCLKLLSEIHKTATVMNDSSCFFSESINESYLLEILLLLKEGYCPHFIDRCAIFAGISSSPLRLIESLHIDSLSEKLNLKLKRGILDDFEEQVLQDVVLYLNSITSVEQLLQQRRSKDNNDQQTLSNRLLFSLVNKALSNVERKLVHAPIEADLLSIQLCGFPAHTGGVLNFIQHIGAKEVEERYSNLREKVGERYKVPKLIKIMNSKGIVSVYQLESYFYQNRIEQTERL